MEKKGCFIGDQRLKNHKYLNIVGLVCLAFLILEVFIVSNSLQTSDPWMEVWISSKKARKSLTLVKSALASD